MDWMLFCPRWVCCLIRWYISWRRRFHWHARSAYARCFPSIKAISSAKFSNTISSFSSFFVLFRRQTIHGKQLLPIIPISLGGGAAGGAIASLLSERTMTIIAIMLLLFALGLQFFKKKPKSSATASAPQNLLSGFVWH